MVVKALMKLTCSTYIFVYELVINHRCQVNFCADVFRIISIVAQSALVVDKMVREEIFQEHDSDVGLSRARLEVDYVAVAHLVVGPVFLDRFVNASLIRMRTQLLIAGMAFKPRAVSIAETHCFVLSAAIGLRGRSCRAAVLAKVE